MATTSCKRAKKGKVLGRVRAKVLGRGRGRWKRPNKIENKLGKERHPAKRKLGWMLGNNNVSKGDGGTDSRKKKGN